MVYINYMEENVKKEIQMRKGVLGMSVLLTLKNKELYAADIIKTLKAVNLLIVEGTLYPLLNRLQREGLLEYSWKESIGGPPRKYYALTATGEHTLSSLETTWETLITSIKKLQQ